MLIGVYEWERRVPQTVQLDLEIGLPPKERRSDRIGDTIDYAKVVGAHRSRAFAENRFLLVEALAEHIAQLVHGRIRRALCQGERNEARRAESA